MKIKIAYRITSLLAIAICLLSLNKDENSLEGTNTIIEAYYFSDKKENRKVINYNKNVFDNRCEVIRYIQLESTVDLMSECNR